MKKYNFISEDEHTFTVRHPDGSDFQVAKQAVGQEVHKRIKSLEPLKMAEGGVVPDEEYNLKSPMAMPQEQKGSFFDMLGVGNFAPDQYTGETALPAAAAIPQPDVSRTPQSVTAQAPLDVQQVSPVTNTTQEPIPQDPSLMGGMNDAYANAFAQKASGIQQVAQAQAQAGKAQEAAYANQVDQMAKLQASYQQEHAKIDAEHKQLTDAVMNQKIDPNRLFGANGTGNKVLAAISVALGGLGSGLNGQPNAALSVIQKSIDRDIEAQRMELGKKQTLLSENLRRYGDLNTAMQATQLQMNALTQAKVSQAAARSGSAQAQAQAQVLLGDLGLQAAQLKQQAAIRSMAQKGGNIDPSSLVPHIVPKEHQKAVFDEIQRAQDTKRMGGSILKAFDEAAKENTVVKTGAGLLRTPGSVYALHQAMQPTFKDLEGTVRQAAMDNTFKNITPSPGDSQHTVDQKKKSLQEYLQSKASAPTAKGFGIDLDKFGSTTTQQGPEVKVMGGVQYKKVPGGWQKI